MIKNITDVLGHVQSHNPDVLTCLANLSSDEVFTPPKVAIAVLDLLPERVWSDPNLTFLDPGCKTGVFLREITSRLMVGLEELIPSPEDRLAHILEKQVFGIAITELTSLICRRTLYCSKNPKSKQSIFKNCKTESGNIFFKSTPHTWRNGFCEQCGAGQRVYDRDDSETYAYNFIHLDDVFHDMNFDIIVGGPPFQLYDGGGTGSSARPVYQKFIERAIELNPLYVAMLTPARWFSGGKGLDEFRQKMLGDKRLRALVDYPDTRECFPTDIAGGICYFLWDRHYDGSCLITTIRGGVATQSQRYLDEFETFIRDVDAVNIIKKVRAKSLPCLESKVSSRKPFGLESNYKPSNVGEIDLRTSKGWSKISDNEIKSGHELIGRWKVMLSKASNDHGGQADKEGLRRIFSRIDILAPGQVCTESYLTVGSYDSKEEATNMQSFLKTKFCRFLVSTVLLTHNISRGTFKYVPSLPMDQSWDDIQLYNYFDLTENEVDFINTHIRGVE